MLTPVNPGNFQVFYLISSLVSMKENYFSVMLKSSEIYMLLHKKNTAFRKSNSLGILVQFTKCFGGENINKLTKVFVP